MPDSMKQRKALEKQRSIGATSVFPGICNLVTLSWLGFSSSDLQVLGNFIKYSRDICTHMLNRFIMIIKAKWHSSKLDCQAIPAHEHEAEHHFSGPELHEKPL